MLGGLGGENAHDNYPVEEVYEDEAEEEARRRHSRSHDEGLLAVFCGGEVQIQVAWHGVEARGRGFKVLRLYLYRELRFLDIGDIEFRTESRNY